MSQKVGGGGGLKYAKKVSLIIWMAPYLTALRNWTMTIRMREVVEMLELKSMLAIGTNVMYGTRTRADKRVALMGTAM